jgi:hydroxypyruvate reductase
MPEAAAADHETARKMRTAARGIFRHVLTECSIQKAFARQVGCDRGVLRVCEDLYDLSSYSRVHVVSIGKAAHTMAEALVEQVGSSVSGIVAGVTDPSAQLPGFRYFRGGHPTPNAESVAAAGAILRSLRALDEDSLALFLLSGGGSAVVEKPLDDEISFDDLISTYRVLVLSGAPIAQINAIRKHLSATKGGRLALAANGAQQVSILVSDVPEDALDSLASGPTMPDSTTVEDCYRIAAQYEMTAQFPASVRELFQRRALEETPKSDDPAFVRARWWLVLSNPTAQQAAAAQAGAAGFAVEVDNSCDDWDYVRAADYLLDKLRRLRRDASRVCLVSGGEVTVKVSNGGTGGRNQQFALYCAQNIAGENITVLSAGTDGIDGNSPAAGAIADGTTVDRARRAGFQPETALARFDAYPLFEALGDAIMTGPTGTNVRDIRVLLAW